MPAEKNNLEETIFLGSDLTLRYQEPEEYNKYLSIYHGQKYAQYYFRESPSALIECCKIFDCGYYIYKNEKIIGGVHIKPNFMADLFVVPPYADFKYLAEQILNHIKKISKRDHPILLREVIEEHVQIYKELGCIEKESGYWMIRPTEQMNAQVPEGYESKSIVFEDAEEIADVIMAAYENNPCMTVDTKNLYIDHVNGFIKNSKDQEVIYNSSKIVINKETQEIVGVCLHMEFEKLPLIMSYAVRPDHQGMGIGSYLLKHSIHYTHKQYPATRLYVDVDNTALNVYEHLGFIKNRALYDLHIPHE